MNINRLNTTDVTRAPSNDGARVINLLSKSGAEGQSRTDTGSPPPVFEFDTGRFTLSHAPHVAPFHS